MIETVQISHNPVALWERFSLDLSPGMVRENFSNLSIEHRAMGGFWQASFYYHDTPIALRQFFADGLGRDVRLTNQRGMIGFEGFVSTMRLVGLTPGIMTRSLDKVANKVWVRYKDSGGTFTRSSNGSGLNSQARYGIKELPLSGGQLQSATTANNVSAMVVARRQWSKIVIEQMQLGGKKGAKAEKQYLEIRCQGYIHTLRWRVYNQTASTGTQSANLQLADILAATGQYIKNTRIDQNTIGVTKEYDADKWAMDVCFDIAKLGDVLTPPQRWVCYMDIDRTFVYEPAAPSVYISIG